MAKNKPIRDIARKGAVKQRSQVLNPKTNLYVRRNAENGQFMDASPLAENLKGLEKKNRTMINTLPNLPMLYPGDVILAKKREGLGRIHNHYIVYVGNNTFVGNISDGVKELSYSELIMLLQDYEPTKVRRFNGSYIQRNEAVNRAYSKLGQRYSLINFNCEHFANWVQFGKIESSQVATGFVILTSAIFLKWISTDE